MPGPIPGLLGIGDSWKIGEWGWLPWEGFDHLAKPYRSPSPWRVATGVLEEGKLIPVLAGHLSSMEQVGFSPAFPWESVRQLNGGCSLVLQLMEEQTITSLMTLYPVVAPLAC